MEKKLTYLLGAGASFESLPLGAEMFKRLNYFKIYLDELFKDKNNGLDEGVAFLLTFFTDEIEKIVKNSFSHSSIDSYAGMLHDRGDAGAMELHKLKMVMSLYFLYEQCSSKTSWRIRDSEHQNGVRNELSSELTNRILTSIDKRYSNWLQQLWRNNKMYPKNTNIISWNYDMQIELYHSLTFQNSLTISDQKLNIFPSVHFFEYEKQESIIVKLNGTAGLDFDTNSGALKWIDRYDYSFEKILPQFLSYFNNNSHRVMGSSPIYSFAWEDEPLTKEARQLAQRVMADSEVLVIIGYSFPNVNAEVDKEIFRNSSKLKKIFVQDTKSGFELVSKRLKRILPKFTKAEIEHESDLSAFLIPEREIESPRIKAAAFGPN